MEWWEFTFHPVSLRVCFFLLLVVFMGRRKLSELSDHEDDEVNTQSEDVYNDGRDSQEEEDEDEDIHPGELDKIDTDNDLDMEDWPIPLARTAQKQTLRHALASVNQVPAPRITRQTKKAKTQQDTVSTAEIQRLKEKTTRLQKQLAIANFTVEGKSRKGQEHPVSAEEFEGPESEEDTQIMYSAVATPLPSMSTPKAPQLNLNRLLSVRKVSGKKPVSRNTFRNVITTGDVTSSPTSEMSAMLVSGSSAPTMSASSCLATSINTTTNTDTGSRAGSSDTQINITPEPSATLPFRTNWQPGARAKTADYAAEGEAILLRAMRDFEARVLGQDFFPDRATRLQWAEKSFQDACATAKAQFISDKRVLKLIATRGSRICGQVYKWIRVNIVSCYKFDVTVGKRAVKQNIALSRLLSSRNFSGFSYKDREAWTGYAEHPSIIFLLSYIFDESNMGMVFEKYFNPISLQTLASLFTMIRAAISEWSSGTCNKIKKFSEEEYDKYYKAYLIDLTKWDGMNPAVSLNIRHRMYAKARIRMREDLSDDSTVHIVGSIEAQLRQEMEARTGETESEPEDSEIDDDGDEDDCGGIEA
ncbi:hypothetical protein C8R41DRAFT_903565 [Lentinula lateritia]|uniref:DUF6532 domain-containing protein n=1 Tax=Lentinula lateritia TaxID=40482 RepID=A0ABQ8VCP2_9AGAR|nr:hypothetical protein C8R41DRAFT_903565 [Lentinula lateritia]